MTSGVLPDIFSQIPDLPRWVYARGLRVPGTNLAGVRLARHLGFEAVDLHWLLTRA